MKRFVVKRVHLSSTARLPEGYYRADGGWDVLQRRAEKYLTYERADGIRRELARAYWSLRDELAVRVVPLRSAA